MSVLQDLYDSEINAMIAWFWDGGFGVEMGDATNGFDANTHCDTYAEVESWLIETACRLYPDSVFARKYGGKE